MFKSDARTVIAMTRVATALLGLSCALGMIACDGTDPGVAGDDAVSEQESELLGPAIGPVNHRLQYFFCAKGDQNENCPIGGSKYVAYGANGSFTFKVLNGTQPCSLATFDGIDPTPGQAKNCYFANYRLLATDFQQGHTLPGTEIAYGANGIFNLRTITTSTFSCVPTTFGGDPVVGVAKGCYAPLPGYGRVAGQNGSISAGSGASVAYGANGNFFFKILSGSASCTVGTFGGDPAIGFSKSCYLMNLRPPIALEGQAINLSTPGRVLYTSGLDGNTLVKNGVTSDVCTFTSFGGDPDLFTNKQCFLDIAP